jgi:hypothetical protein
MHNPIPPWFMDFAKNGECQLGYVKHINARIISNPTGK